MKAHNCRHDRGRAKCARRDYAHSACRASLPNVESDDQWDNERDPSFDGDAEAPWDDFGWDFEDDEPQPEYGDFWPETDREGGDG